MKKIEIIAALFFIGVAFTMNSFDAGAWGQKGHDITCAVAQRHLTRKAKKEISQILDGKSIVYWANWMDNASHTPEFAYTKTWHYKDIGENEEYDNAVLNENGDVVTAIEAQVAALKSGTLNKQAKATALKMLVHFVGDLHCPMHIAHKEDKGGNLHQVQFFKNGKNLHSVWDSDIVESAHKWTYSEWVEQIDILDKKEIKKIVEGTPNDWGRDTYNITSKVYAVTPSGAKLSYDYVSDMSPLAERQLLYAGLRLASVLNDIFK